MHFASRRIGLYWTDEVVMCSEKGPIVLDNSQFKRLYKFEYDPSYPIDHKLFQFVYYFGGRLVYPILSNTAFLNKIKESLTWILNSFQKVTVKKQLEMQNQLNILGISKERKVDRIKVSMNLQNRTLDKIDRFLAEFEFLYSHKSFRGKITPGMIAKLDKLAVNLGNDFSQEQAGKIKTLREKINKTCGTLVSKNMLRQDRGALYRLFSQGIMSRFLQDTLGPLLVKQYKMVKAGKSFRCMEINDKKGREPQLRSNKEVYQSVLYKAQAKRRIVKDPHKQNIYDNIIYRAKSNLKRIKRLEKLNSQPNVSEIVQSAQKDIQFGHFDKELLKQSFSDQSKMKQLFQKELYTKFKSGDQSIKLSEPGADFYEIARNANSLEILQGLADECKIPHYTFLTGGYSFSNDDIKLVRESICEKIFEMFCPIDVLDEYTKKSENEKLKYFIEKHAPEGWDQWNNLTTEERNIQYKKSLKVVDALKPVTVPGWYHSTKSTPHLLSILLIGKIKTHKAAKGHGAFMSTKYEKSFGDVAICFDRAKGWNSTPVNSFPAISSIYEKEKGAIWTGFSNDINVTDPVDRKNLKAHYIIVNEQSNPSKKENSLQKVIQQIFGNYLPQTYRNTRQEISVESVKKMLQECNFDAEVVSSEEAEIERLLVSSVIETPFWEPDYYKNVNPNYKK